jgi:hypothetical protein
MILSRAYVARSRQSLSLQTLVSIHVLQLKSYLVSDCLVYRGAYQPRSLLKQMTVHRKDIIVAGSIFFDAHKIVLNSRTILYSNVSRKFCSSNRCCRPTSLLRDNLRDNLLQMNVAINNVRCYARISISIGRILDLQDEVRVCGNEIANGPNNMSA